MFSDSISTCCPDVSRPVLTCSQSTPRRIQKTGFFDLAQIPHRHSVAILTNHTVSKTLSAAWTPKKAMPSCILHQQSRLGTLPREFLPRCKHIVEEGINALFVHIDIGNEQTHHQLAHNISGSNQGPLCLL